MVRTLKPDYLSPSQVERVEDAALYCVNVYGTRPLVRIYDTHAGKELHIVYPSAARTGNMVDHQSLNGLHHRLTKVLMCRLGSIWIGWHGDDFTVWCNLNH